MLYFWILFWFRQSQGISQELVGLILYVVVALFLFALLFVVFFSTFQQRKNQLFIDKINQQKAFDEELVKTQQEIQEETLKHVGRELHDNIGQLLVVATMQLNTVSKVVDGEVATKVDGASSALKETLAEVRALSKSLNSDVIFNLGFDATVKNEIIRLNKIGLVTAHFEVIGEKVNFENKKDEIILFRILQEFFSNTLKYAEATLLKVTIHYQLSDVIVIVEDDGVGFDIATVQKGSGLINMQKRAELIKASFDLESHLNQGTTLTLSYKYNCV